MAIKKINFDDIKNSKGKSKQGDLDKLTDAQINEAALSDPDSFIPTDEEMKEFEKVGKKDKPRE